MKRRSNRSRPPLKGPFLHSPRNVDNIRNPFTEEEETKFLEYVTDAQKLTSQTTSLLIELDINKEQLASVDCAPPGLMRNVHPNSNRNTVARIELPKLPIP